MLENGIIVPSKSEWNFPLIAVPQKLDVSGERKWRICVDFRKLHDITTRGTFQLLNIQEILDDIQTNSVALSPQVNCTD
jgi:hypothetical protein